MACGTFLTFIQFQEIPQLLFFPLARLSHIVDLIERLACVQRTLQIPYEAASQLPDPRPEAQQTSSTEIPDKRRLLALPSFALLPAKVAKPEESDGYSWADAPYEVVEDDALSAGALLWLSAL